MVLWLLIAILATLVAGVLVVAARRAIPEPATQPDANQQHFRTQLREIDADQLLGRLSAPEAEAAKAELARDVIRFRKENSIPVNSVASRLPWWMLPLIALAGPLLALAIYAMVGQPELPSQAAATRTAPGQLSCKGVDRAGFPL